VLVAAGSLWTLSILGLTDTAAAPTAAPRDDRTPDASGVVPSPDEPQPTATPHPTIVITPPPDRTATVQGQILFTKSGDIYRVTGRGDIKALTRKGIDSAPTWTPDGKRIVFVETRQKQVEAPYDGRLTKYTFFYPNIVSIDADGGDRRQIHESIFPSGGGQWHRWVLQPDVSPDGRTIALVSDGRDGYGDVTLSTMTIRGQNLQQLDVPSIDGLGHNDPAWSPDGSRLAFTYDVRNGQIGAPKIGILNVRSGKVSFPTKPGYANPSWSPDGRYLAAERTTGVGRDIVILDANNGSEVARLSNDGDSFAPTFSPNGDQIAFLRRKGLGVDLWVMTLDPANRYTRLEAKPVTEDGGLDAESPPSWFIPAGELTPVATPVASAPSLPSPGPSQVP
jgi:Tol biopolymer transport system component